MQTLTPWTAPDPVVRQLSDAQGFQKAVAPSSAAAKAFGILLVIGLALLAYNLVSVFRTMSEYDAGSDRFFEVFFSTTGENFSTDPMLVAYVWGPIILIPLAIIMLVVSKLTRGKRTQAAFAAYSRDGYVAKGLGLPFRFAANNSQVVPQVIVPAHLGSEEVSRWMAGVAQQVSTLDKAGSKQLTKTLVSKLSKPEVAIPAETVFPGAPPFALLVHAPDAVGAETVRAVVPGERSTRAYIVNLSKVEGWS